MRRKSKKINIMDTDTCFVKQNGINSWIYFVCKLNVWVHEIRTCTCIINTTYKRNKKIERIKKENDAKSILITNWCEFCHISLANRTWKQFTFNFIHLNLAMHFKKIQKDLYQELLGGFFLRSLHFKRFFIWIPFFTF